MTSAPPPGRMLPRRGGRPAARATRALIAVAALAAPALLGGCLAAHGGLRHLGPGQCKPGAPLAGVYLPFRLHVVSRCVTVTGTVDCVRREADGDVHIRLRVDPPFRRLLTPANAFQRCPGGRGSAGLGPRLVVEIIPQNVQLPVVDNNADRGGFVTPAAPQPGDHVSVTGPYVLDSNALHDLLFPGHDVKNWAEIHPAWNVMVQPHVAARTG